MYKTCVVSHTGSGKCRRICTRISADPGQGGQGSARVAEATYKVDKHRDRTRKNAGPEYWKTVESKLNDAKDSGFIIQATCQELIVCKKNLFKNARFIIAPFKELVGFPPTSSLNSSMSFQLRP